MNGKLKYCTKFLVGFAILLLFYFLSYFIVKLLHIAFPPAILGLVLFAIALIEGGIKEDWIKDVCEFLMKNMAMFLVPFLGGLITYKSLLMKNGLALLAVIFIGTTLVIVITGLFVEWGIKLLKLHKMRGHND